MPALIARQRDGYFTSESKDDKYACTALAIHSMQVYFAYSPPFWQGVAGAHDKDEDIRIDIR